MRGAGFMIAAMAGFAANDALMKAVLADMPLFQAVFLRGLGATALLLALVRRRGALAAPSRADAAVLGWRSLGEIGATICFLTALARMPIANATAILQAMPLAVTLAAAVFLSERVGWRRWSAILAGFGGVLLIVRPGTDAFDPAALWAMGAVGFMTLRDLSTRRLSPRIDSSVAALATSAAITAMAGLVMLGGETAPVGLSQALRLGGAAGFILVGYLFIVMAMRVGEIGFVAPFRYAILLFATLLGAAFFDEIPDAATLAGSAIVIGAGLYAFARERRLAARSRPAAR